MASELQGSRQASQLACCPPWLAFMAAFAAWWPCTEDAALAWVVPLTSLGRGRV